MADSSPKQIYTTPLHPSLQFLILVCLTIGALIIGSFIGITVVMASYGKGTLNEIAQYNISSQSTVIALWIIQFAGATLPLLLAPVFFSYVIIRNPDNYLKTTFHFPWILIVLVLLTMLFSSPLIEVLSNINQKMVLPTPLKGVERWMRDSEDSAQKLSEAMLLMKSIKSLLFDLLFIGFLTAIVEEFLFRGAMQTVFLHWTKNYHAAIWITAILFSAFHMEFYGFLPRLLLGVLFGYFVAWSGSVWTSVWAHFVNNGTAVIVTYLFQHKLISINPDDQHVFNYPGYVISLIITLFLLFVYQYVSKKHSVAVDGEELD